MPIRPAREIFLTGPHKAALEQMVQTAAFEVACQTALLALVEEQPMTFNTPEESWRQGVYIAGARRVLALLSALPFKDEESKRPGLPSLNYKV